MYGLLSTPAMSSMRPPMLAGPIPRQTKRFNIGSLDQLIGVGVGLAGGVALRVGDGVCAAEGVWEGIGFSACAANAPSPIAKIATAQIAHTSPQRSRAEELHFSFIWETSFRLIVITKLLVAITCRRKTPKTY